MNAKIAAATTVCLLAALPFLFSCDEPAKPAARYDSLTVIKPATGESLKAGSTVTVEWGYPESWQYQKVVVDVSISNSKMPNWKTISIDPVFCPKSTLEWAIPSGAAGDSCRIKIYDYDKNVFAFSGFFRVTE